MADTKPTNETISSLLSSIEKFTQNMSSHLKLYTSYNVVYEPVKYEELKNGNPLQSRIDEFKNNKSKFLTNIEKNPLTDRDGKNLHINGKDYDNAIKYLVFKELKLGESLTIAGNQKISYEDFVKVAKDVENVSDKDASFDNKMPKIFIIAKFPPKNSKEEYILKKITSPQYYNSIIDSVIIAGDPRNQTTEAVKGTFAHEYGHRLLIATNGKATIKYSPDKFADYLSKSPLGGKFSTDCDVPVIGSKMLQNLHQPYRENPTKHNEECAEDIEEINNKKKLALLIRDFKSNELSQKNEVMADKYATTAGYGDGIIILNQKYPNEYSINNTHPSSDERIKTAQKIQSDPITEKIKFENELNDLKNQASLSKDIATANAEFEKKFADLKEHISKTNYENKAPPSTPIPNQKPISSNR